ncbi:MAG: Nif3-like dinuclear metal center hexameric protein [Anaerolineae bacterium]
MTTTNDIIAYIESLTGHHLNRDEGVQHGSGDQSINKVLVTWMATAPAIARAGETDCQLVLCHESLYFPYDAYIKTDNPKGWEDWPTNRQRRELLDKHDLVLLRAHGSLDEVCIFDDFAALLGLGQAVEGKGYSKVYEVDPLPLSELIDKTAKRMGLDTLRYTAPRGLNQIVHRIGLPWGGLGLFVNVSYQQQCIARSCDVLIGGESDSYGLHFANELGIPFIETGHELSENPGLAHWVLMLEKRFPDLAVEYYDCKPAYYWWNKA